MSEEHFQWALTVVIIIACVLAVLCVLLAISYAIVAHRLTRRMRNTVGRIERLLAEAQMRADRKPENPLSAATTQMELDDLIPPIRIRLLHSQPKQRNALIERIDHWLLQHSFNFVGIFRVEHDGERLELYLSDDRLMVAAIRQAAVSETIYVEFCVDLGEGRRGGVSNPPGCHVPLPDDAVGMFFQGDLHDDFSLLSQMWLAAKDIVDENDVHVVDAKCIKQFYEDAHAAEMDWRIVHGGVSEQEIRQAFAAQGIAGTEQDVQAIQLRWQRAIDRHILSASRLSNRRPATELLVVHDGSSAAHLLNQLDRMYQSPSALELAKAGSGNKPGLQAGFPKVWAQELDALLELFSPREAVSRLRPLLPPESRYSLVEQIVAPVDSDVYQYSR